MVTIRPFEAGDAEECCRIINASISTMEGLNPAARALVIAKNDPPALAAELAGCHAVVAEGPGGKLEGVGALDGAVIRRIYVRAGGQRRGTGRVLLAALEAQAVRQGLTRLTLQASLSSVPFYQALGYQRLGDDVSRNGEAEVRHVAMAKALADGDRTPPEGPSGTGS